VLTLAVLTTCELGHAGVDDVLAGRWSGGAGVGFLAGTPDGVEPAFKAHVDYFLLPRLSIGLLAQHAGAGGNDSVVGLSVQAKYWWDLPGTGRAARLVVQGGVGLAWADIEDDDSGVADTYRSLSIPVGIGLEYAVMERVAITAELLLNLVSLGEEVRVGGREVDLHTNVMPGFYLGIRF
jgi:hypothetical protein